MSTQVPGLFIQYDIVPEDTETNTLRELDEGFLSKKWSNELSRRTLHQGYKYPYKGGKLEKIEPLSGGLLHFAKYIRDNGLMGKDTDDQPKEPDQCIVNEYLKDQGISAHTDRNVFGDIIISFSLGGDTNFIFRNPKTDEKVELYVPRRSIMIMSGDSRHIWTHEIPKRKTITLDEGNRVNKPNDYRRVSLTYRTVNDD